MARPPAKEREKPRISVNDLALYMVASDTARIGILKRAKYPQTPPIIRYKDVRAPICSYLCDPSHGVNPLTEAELRLQQRRDDPTMSALRRDDAERSIEVLHAIQRMRNQIATYDFRPAPHVQTTLMIEDVEISIRADCLVYGNTRGKDQIGAAIFRMTADDAATESARDKRRAMGLYVATLARLHVEAHLKGDREPANRLCLSVDIQHGEVFVAPNANTTRMNDIRSVCQFICAIWPSIK